MLPLTVGNAEHFERLQAGGTPCLGNPQECGEAGIEQAGQCMGTLYSSLSWC